MHAILKILTITCIVILFLGFRAFTEESAVTQSAQGLQTMSVVPTQLPSDHGYIPVELRCGLATLRSSNIIEGFSCVLHNNSDKRIRAADVRYSIAIDQLGTSNTVTYDSTFETSLHPDFFGMIKLIGSGEESGNMGPPGPISYESGSINRIEIAVDYVEFEDGSFTGPDRQGSKIIKDMREGARKYGAWLKTQYKLKGRSVESIVPLFETEQILPNDIDLSTPDQESGAKQYQGQLRKLFRTKGKSEIARIVVRGQ